MSDVLFDDKSKAPDQRELKEVLGKSMELWTELKRSIISEFDRAFEEWAWSGKNYGWALRLKQKKRAILYMKPLRGSFRVSFALSEKAVSAALQSKLPESTADLINNAQKYPEGRAIRIEIRSKRELSLILKLARIKMEN